MQNSRKIVNRFLATINALKAGFRAAIGEDEVPEPALIRRGFTNIPKCIVSRLMQRCTSSDTLALRGSLTFSFHPSPSTVPRPLFHRPVHASHAVSVVHSLSTRLAPPFNSSAWPARDPHFS